VAVAVVLVVLVQTLLLALLVPVVQEFYGRILEISMAVAALDQQTAVE
jgi:hypothetical protein